MKCVNSFFTSSLELSTSWTFHAFLAFWISLQICCIANMGWANVFRVFLKLKNWAGGSVSYQIDTCALPTFLGSFKYTFYRVDVKNGWILIFGWTSFGTFLILRSLLMSLRDIEKNGKNRKSRNVEEMLGWHKRSTESLATNLFP